MMKYYKDLAKKIIDEKGGYREKEIVKDCTMEIGHTWNNSHKVIRIKNNDTGHCCEVDIIQNYICG